MEQILTRCGYRCDLCLAYRPNVQAHPTNQLTLSHGWQKYFGFRIPCEDVLCDGCMSEHPRLIDKACLVRPCVIERRLPNCSHCPDYICEKLADRLVVYEELAARQQGLIPPEDRARFIEPYENKVRLDRLRPLP